MDRGGRAGSRPRRPSLAGAVRARDAKSNRAEEAPLRTTRAVLPPGLVLLGEFGRPHGLVGEIRLKSYTGEPKAIASYGPLTGQDGRAYTITHARQAAGDQPDLLVVRVDGITTRDTAEALNRLKLHVPRERLGQPEEDEFFLADLVGLLAEGPEGPVGRVVAVPDYGGGELLEIAIEGRRRTALLPFTRALVPVIDIAGGLVRIDPPAGWLDEDQDDDERS